MCVCVSVRACVREMCAKISYVRIPQVTFTRGFLSLRNVADFVQVDVSLTLADETFTEELEDSTSAEYKALEKTVKDEVDTMLSSFVSFTFHS